MASAVLNSHVHAPHRALRGTALASLAIALVMAGLAFAATEPASLLSSGPWRLAIYGAFLFFDLIAIASGIALAALRRSAAWSLLPVAAILAVFIMLFPAFEAFQAVRG